MFEIMLGYALVFSSREDYDLCLDLLKQAIFILDAIKSNLDHVPKDEVNLTSLFNNRLLQSLVTNLDLSDESLNERQKLFLELIFKVFKLKELVKADQEKENKSSFFSKLTKMVFTDKDRINQINWPISDALQEAIELFRVIENVNHLTSSLELENL